MAVSSNLPAETGDIVAYKGDTFKRWVQILRNGQEESLSTSTFRMQIKSGSQILIELSSVNSSILSVSLGSGVLILTLTAEQMSQLEPGSYRYDMQQTYPDGTIITRFRGAFQIVDDITKS